MTVAAKRGDLRLLVFAMAVVTVTSLVFTVANALEGYQIVRSAVTRLLVGDTQVKIVRLEVEYNPDTQQWNGVHVRLNNPYQAPVNVTLNAAAKEGNVVVARGSRTVGPIPANSTREYGVIMSWNAGKTIYDVGTVEVTITEVE